tara:strand:- start:454 stop:1749 length:1296 start_codon:yes stop_codon:yes gene_type:complete
MASSTITHFISPIVIDVDDVNSKVEAVIDFVPIPVHAAYICDVPLSLRCVNTSPVHNESLYQIQDLDGTPLSVSDISQIIESLLPYLKHADVSGSLVVEPDLLGSKLSVLNNNLANMLNPTNVSDKLGNFSIKKEVLKTISSYLTNHTSLSLVNTITDLSGVASSQLNTSNHIASELKRFETVQLDASGDDTKPFLNAFLDRNNDNEIFGENTISTVIFIVASKVNLNNDPTQNTGIEISSLSAINSIDYREIFTDELGDPLQPQISSDRLNGKWYAALCFNIAPSNSLSISDFSFDFNYVLNVGSSLDGSYDIYVPNNDITFEEYQSFDISDDGAWGFGGGSGNDETTQQANASFYADIYNSNTNNSSGLVVRVAYHANSDYYWNETLQEWQLLNHEIGYYEVDGTNKSGPFKYFINNLTSGRWLYADKL